jgi:transposase
LAIKWELYRKIRQLYLVDKMSQRAISRLLNVSRRTIRKYCEGAILPDMRNKSGREPYLLKIVADDIMRLLEENKKLPRKERMSGVDIWKYLVQEKGVRIGETTVRQYIRELRGSHPEVYLPLKYEPGDAIQFDWGEMKAYVGGVKIPVSVLCAVLPCSGAISAFVYPDEKELSFLDGHIRVFETFGGVSRRCIYDNLRVAAKSGSGKKAVKQDDFMRVEAHYGFEAVFCNAYSAWEKSSVENAVAIVRTIAFTPAPRVDSYEELQEHVTNKCLVYAKEHVIRGREKSIWQDYLDEKKQLLPLPQIPFDPGFTATALVHPDMTVIHNGTHYSVPRQYVGKEVTIRLGPFHLRIYYKGEMIWEHRRIGERREDQYVLEHYLEILERKPRAIGQAVPLSRGVMPQPCKEFLQLCKEKDARRQLVDVMLLGKTVSQERLLWAIEQANNTLNPSQSLVRFFLDADLHGHPEDTVTVRHKDLSAYDNLIHGGDVNGKNERK